MKVLTIIPAKLDSTRLPKKNIQKITILIAPQNFLMRHPSYQSKN